MELLNVKELADGQKYFGLYLEQLQLRVKALPALNQPMLGDGLVKSDTDNTFWMAAMIPKGIKLDMKDLKQQAAMPLASFLRHDPWTDQLVQMHSAFEPLLSDRDKMPFEVEPVYMKLTYFKARPPERSPTPRRQPLRRPRRRPDPPPARQRHRACWRCWRHRKSGNPAGCAGHRPNAITLTAPSLPWLLY